MCVSEHPVCEEEGGWEVRVWRIVDQHVEERGDGVVLNSWPEKEGEGEKRKGERERRERTY